MLIGQTKWFEDYIQTRLGRIQGRLRWDPIGDRDFQGRRKKTTETTAAHRTGCDIYIFIHI